MRGARATSHHAISSLLKGVKVLQACATAYLVKNPTALLILMNVSALSRAYYIFSGAEMPRICKPFLST